jgi:transcriptional regulator with XRE-family HTH domain
MRQGFETSHDGTLRPFQMRKAVDDNAKDAFGRKVRELRISLNMSQADLADKTETRQAFISEIERGEANPTLDSLLRIATALGVSLGKLFDSRRG